MYTLASRRPCVLGTHALQLGSRRLSWRWASSRPPKRTDGTSFTYHGFSWRTFEGVFSSSAPRRVKAKMISLEGLFCKLGAATGQDRDSILRRMVALRAPRGVEDETAMDAQWFEQLPASATAMEPPRDGADDGLPVDYAGGEGHHQMFQ